MKFSTMQIWKRSMTRIMISLALCLLPCGALLHSEEDDPDLKEIDPAARVKKLEDALGKDFVQDSKNVKDIGSAAKALSGLKVWESTPAQKNQAAAVDPQIYGVDVSSAFDMQEIAEPVGVYRYSAFGKPDPFLAPYDQYRQTRVTAMEIPIVSPLQVPLPQLKVAGLWELEDGSRKALILTQQGEGVIAKIGDPIGLSGKIIDIFSNGVVSRQYKIRADGSREFQDLTLAFGDNERDNSSDKIVLEPGKEPVVSGPEKKGDTTVINNVPPPVANNVKAGNDKPAEAPLPAATAPAIPEALKQAPLTDALPAAATNQILGGSQ